MDNIQVHLILDISRPDATRYCMQLDNGVVWCGWHYMTVALGAPMRDYMVVVDTRRARVDACKVWCIFTICYNLDPQTNSE